MMALSCDDLSTATARGFMVSTITLAALHLDHAAAYVAIGDASAAARSMRKASANFWAALDTLPEAVSEIERDGGGAP
jgi:hypothetical protein